MGREMLATSWHSVDTRMRRPNKKKTMHDPEIAALVGGIMTLVNTAMLSVLGILAIRVIGAMGLCHHPAWMQVEKHMKTIKVIIVFFAFGLALMIT